MNDELATLLTEVEALVLKAKNMGVVLVPLVPIKPSNSMFPVDCELLLACVLCGVPDKLEVWGESGTFWLHCHACNRDGPDLPEPADEFWRPK